MFDCFKNRRIKKEIPVLSDYIPDRTVCLIIPHTIKKQGAYSSQLNISEYEYMKDFYLDDHGLVDFLDDYGIKTLVFDRSVVGIYGAYKEALEHNPFLIMEWHFNAFNGKAHGFELLYKPDLSHEKKIAEDIMDTLGSTLKSKPRRKIKVSKGERGFKNVSQTSKVPSILIEPFFGDNSYDAKNFDDKKHLLAQNIAKMLDKYAPLF